MGAEGASFLRSLKALRAWQVRDVAVALAVPRARSKGTAVLAITEVFEDAGRRREAEKALEAVSRGIKRPGIVKCLHDSFESAA